MTLSFKAKLTSKQPHRDNTQVPNSWINKSITRILICWEQVQNNCRIIPSHVQYLRHNPPHVQSTLQEAVKRVVAVPKMLEVTLLRHTVGKNIRYIVRPEIWLTNNVNIIIINMKLIYKIILWVTRDRMSM